VRQTRLLLVSSLLIAVLLPAVPVALTTRSLFRRSLDPVSRAKLLETIREGIDSTRELLDREDARLEQRIRAGEPVDTLGAGEIDLLPESEQASIEAFAILGPPPDPRAEQTQILLAPERMTIRGQDRLLARVVGPGGEPVWVTSPLPAELTGRLARLDESLAAMETVWQRERSTLSRLLTALVLIYALAAAAILVAGLWLAEWMTRPLAILREAVARGARGDLDTLVPEAGGGEIGGLNGDLARMLHRLREGRLGEQRTERLRSWSQAGLALSRELAAPVRAIRGRLRTIRESDGSQAGARPPELAGELASVETELARIERLADRCSDLAGLGAGRRESIDLGDLLERIASRFGRQRVRIHVPEGGLAKIPPLRGHRDQISQALAHLVENSLEAQEASGSKEPVEITVSVETGAGVSGGSRAAPPRNEEAAGSRLRVQVADRGPGIPASELARIFEPERATRLGLGGLGLAIVETAVLNHGGSVTAARRPGGGTSFTLTLPLQPFEPSEET
jgi:signal transduction histidine kinase